MHKYLTLKPLIFMLLASALTMAVPPVRAYTASYYATTSALGSGRWVRVKVSETGMQQITREQLESWGFKDMSRVSVFGYGGASLVSERLSDDLPDDLPQQPVMVADDKLIFFGEASLRHTFVVRDDIETLRNHYSDGGYYFITDSRTPLAPETSPFVLSSTGVYNHVHIEYHEEDVQNPADAGAHFFGPLYGENLTHDVNVPIDDYCPDSDLNIRWRIRLMADGPLQVNYRYGSQSASYSHRLESSIMSYYYSFEHSFVGNYDDRYATDGYCLGWDVTPGVKDVESNISTETATDYWRYLYPRYTRLGERGSMLLHYPVLYSSSNYYIRDAHPGVCVWEVCSPTSVRALATSYDDEDGTMTFSPSAFYSYSTGQSGRIAVFDPAAELNAASFAGEVANTDIHGCSTPQMLIVTTDNCYSEAMRLASLHRLYQGLDVLVVTQRQVFDEFSSGTPDAMALRRLCRMFRDRDGSRLRHLLLFGAGSFDNRGIVHNFVQSSDLLLTYPTSDYEISGTHAASFSSDAFFGILYDTTESAIAGKMDINVGRIPAINAAEAMTAVNKIERYLSATPDPEMAAAALIIADDGDQNIHIRQQEDVDTIIGNHAPYVTRYKVYDNLYPMARDRSDNQSAQRKVIERLGLGTHYLCYAGHGNFDAITGTKLWSRLLVNDTDYERPPFVMLSTCDAFGYDRMDDGIGHRMIFKDQGGALGLIGACRTVFQDRNYTLAVAVTRRMYDGSATTMGDVFRLAFNDISDIACDAGGNMALVYNTACYNFGGDPALPLRTFTREAVIETVNGKSAAGDEACVLTAKKFNTVKGCITDGNGRVDAGFDGSAIITVYDGARSQRTVNQGDAAAQGTELINITLDETCLASVKVPVRKGVYSGKLYLPIPRKPGGASRVTVTAISDGDHTMAVGYTANTSLCDYDYDQRDIDVAEPPRITEMYIDTPDFRDGDEINGSFTLYATVDPGNSGLRTAGGSPVTPLRLKLDGVRSYSDAINTSYRLNDDGTVSVAVPFDMVNDGRHILELTATSAADEIVSRAVNFTFIARSARASLSVREPVATTRATFDLMHDLPQPPAGRLVVEDADGNTVYSVTDCAFPCSWDLRDASGAPVSDGVYRAYAIISGGPAYASTQPVTVTVMR